ncbi:hypothetical protein ABPG72_013766 [Tetrahymena utriculariae]
MIADDFESEFYDTSLDRFETYEQYLDEHITEEDMFYLEDRELARQLREQNNHNAKAEILTREQFEAKKQAVKEARSNQNKDKTKSLAHTEVKNKAALEKDEFLKALADREQDVLNGKLLTIIFIRFQSKHSEISGYIDYAHRLKTEDFKPYFEGKKKLLPRTTDLSYYNWKTSMCVSNDSPNFKVDANSQQQALLFRNKRDRKVINVDPKKKEEDNTKRIDNIKSDYYKQIVLYDHYTRRKN